MGRIKKTKSSKGNTPEVRSDYEDYTSLMADIANLPADYDPFDDPDIYTSEPYYDGPIMTDEEIDAFEEDGGSEDTAVMCIFCKNCTEFTPDVIKCKAFPAGVPMDILLGFDHRNRLRDEQILFEAKNQMQFDEWMAGIKILMYGSNKKFHT